MSKKSNMRGKKVAAICAATLARLQRMLSQRWRPAPGSTYNQLDPERKEIRLLKIKPGSGEKGGRIQLEMITVDMATNPQFIALSYTWGSKKRSMNVKVNGFLLGVRMNLHNFLMIMQKDTQFCETKLLWIDQICIDQSNVRERNHQVGQMSEIYKTAAEVLIWLGPGTSHSRSLVMAIDNFYGFNTPPDRICALKFQRLFKASQFLNLPYWSRLWIIQEVLLARCLRITWGIDRLDWVKLDFLIKGLIFGGHLANAGVDDGLGSNSKDHLQRLVEARQHDRQKDGNYRYSWHGALALAEYTDCQDPRDRIYGLLGLLDPSQAIQPDYTKPLYQVFDEMMAVAPDRTTNRIVRYI